MNTQERLIDDCKNVFLKRLKHDYNINISKNDIIVSSEVTTDCLRLQYSDLWTVFTKVKL